MPRSMNYCLMGFAMVVSLCWSMDMAAECIASLHPELRRQADHLHDMQTEIASFGAQLDRVLEDVGHGRTSLGDAGRALERYAADHCPTYLASLKLVGPERPIAVKLAWTLLQDLELNERDRVGASIGPERLAQLKCEYQAMLADRNGMP